MAIYHLSVKIGSRANGKSAVASSSYRSAEKLHSQSDNKTFDYRRKQSVVYTEIMLPENAPREYADRATLWNSVEKAERQSNAQLYREFEISIPNECGIEQKVEMVRRFADSLRQEGMCVDIAIHDVKAGQYKTKGQRATKDNCHAHIMCTMRSIGKDGKFLAKQSCKYKLDESGNKIPVLGKDGKQKVEKKTGRRLWQRETVKNNDWDKKEKVSEWRARWAGIANSYLPEDRRIDHRTLEAQLRDMEEEARLLDEKIEEANRQIEEQDAKERERGEKLRGILASELRRVAGHTGRDPGGSKPTGGRVRKIESQPTTDRAANTDNQTARVQDGRADRLRAVLERREREAADLRREREETARREREAAERKRRAREADEAERQRNSRTPTSEQGFSR